MHNNLASHVLVVGEDANNGGSLWDVRMEVWVLLLWGIIIYAVAGKIFKWE